MSEPPKAELQAEFNSNAGDNLRQALMRLTSPQVDELQRELVQLKEELDELKRLAGDSNELQKKLISVSQILDDVEIKSRLLADELRNPIMIGQRLETTIVPALHKQVENQGDEVAETLAPVIGPAMRRQIRDAKDDIVDALYPVIGQIINKAISEALRELTRSIDTRLRQQLNFRDRINQATARLRGISEAELLIRGSLPYSIERVFLVHRKTGLLLSHVSADLDSRAGMDTISGMLTAIQDFVRDSFSDGEGDLEEITHGDRRILLEGGQLAYVAVVLSGVEPEGYNRLIRDVVHHINVQYENALMKFDGDMGQLPDLRSDLGQLLSPQSALAELEAGKPMPRAQKRVIGITLAALLLLVATLIFACVFVIRLWPIAFYPAQSKPVPTPTYIPSPTPTVRAALTPTASATFPIGILTGNLYVRTEPFYDSTSLGVILAGEKVIIRGNQGNWYLISWPVDEHSTLDGWINGEGFLDILIK
jgi:hypothetical protein